MAIFLLIKCKWSEHDNTETKMALYHFHDKYMQQNGLCVLWQARSKSIKPTAKQSIRLQGKHLLGHHLAAIEQHSD